MHVDSTLILGDLLHLTFKSVTLMCSKMTSTSLQVLSCSINTRKELI